MHTLTFQNKPWKINAQWGTVPNFEKGGEKKKMSAWGDLKEFLPWIFVWGRLLCFLSKKTFKNKIRLLCLTAQFQMLILACFS